MKKFSLIILSLVIIALAGCQSPQAPTEVTTTPDETTTIVAEQPAPPTQPTTPTNTFNEEPLPVDTINPFPGYDYTKELSNGTEVKVLESMDPDKALLRFTNFKLTSNDYTFRGTDFITPTFEFDNPNWFNFDFVALDIDEIYFADNGGFEAMPRHYIANGNKLINFTEVLQGILVDKFPNEPFPQFGVTFYPSYIRVEEENYCCDTTYDATNPERKEYRKVFYLERDTYQILEEDKVARF